MSYSVTTRVLDRALASLRLAYDLTPNIVPRDDNGTVVADHIGLTLRLADVMALRTAMHTDVIHAEHELAEAIYRLDLPGDTNGPS